jgi:hypothetical protein
MGEARAGTVFFWGAVVLAACGGSAGSISGPVGQRCSGTVQPPANETHVCESDNGTCGAPRHSLTGTKNPGENCASPTDCKPTCCAFATGSKIAWAASCRNNVCASSDDTCCTFDADTSAQTTCQ